MRSSSLKYTALSNKVAYNKTSGNEVNIILVSLVVLKSDGEPK